MTEKVYISVSEAIKMASDYGIEVSRPTAINWIKQYDLGSQVSGKGKWLVSSHGWEDFLLNRTV